MARIPTESTGGKPPPGRLRLFAVLQSAYLRGALRAGNSLFQISSVLTPVGTWLKWWVGGVPTSKIPCCGDRLSLLDLAAATAKTDGMWLEFGVWKAESLNHLAGLTRDKVYGFDSFEGLPETWHLSMKRGVFSTGGVLPRTAENVVLVKGWFQDTLPKFLETMPGAKAALIHVDCDLYKSARLVLWELHSRIGPGTVIIFDEFAGIMPDDEARAFREFVRFTGASYQYLGCSANGSVAVRVV